MKEFKLHLEKPEAYPDQEKWKQTSEKIMEVLRKNYNLKDESCLCGTLLGEMFDSRELKCVSLLSMGSDWPGMVLQIATLRIRGTGACPNCGSWDGEQKYDGYYKDELGETADLTNFKCRDCLIAYPSEN